MSTDVPVAALTREEAFWICANQGGGYTIESEKQHTCTQIFSCGVDEKRGRFDKGGMANLRYLAPPVKSASTY